MTTDIEQRPASLGGRILRHWATRFVIMFVVLTALYAAVQIAPMFVPKDAPKTVHDWARFVAAAAGIPVMLLVYTGLVRWLERRTPEEIALRPAAGQLIIGTIVGVVLFSAVIGLLVISGHGVVVVPATFVFPLVALALSLISGVGEELIFRGATFRIVEDRFGTLVGMALSAAFFGAVHIGNPAATITSSTAIALEAGLMLALAYTATRTLWLPIGLHFAWNFTEGGIFTTEVSGGKVPGILKTTLTGPEIVTGGKFGPEASIVAVGVCLTLALVFLVITIRRGQWKPFSLWKPTAA